MKNLTLIYKNFDLIAKTLSEEKEVNISLEIDNLIFELRLKLNEDDIDILYHNRQVLTINIRHSFIIEPFNYLTLSNQTMIIDFKKYLSFIFVYDLDNKEIILF